MDKGKPSEWKVNSVHPLYLTINEVYRIVTEKNSLKLLTTVKGDALNKYKQVFSGIKHHIKKMGREEFGNSFFMNNFNNNYERIKFLTDDSLPLKELIYFPTLTVVIRCVFNQGGIYYPQVYLDDALYQI